MNSQPIGRIAMSQFMYGSLRYIESKNGGSLSATDVLLLKQTQLRSFKKHQWIVERKDGSAIDITKLGREVLREMSGSDGFFRTTTRLSFTSLLNLRLPEAEPSQKPANGAKPIPIQSGRAHRKSA